MSKTIPHVTLLVESTLYVRTSWVRLKGVFIEQDSKVRVASAHKELFRDVRNMITGFLKNNRMELSTGRRDNIGGVPAGRSWIPLKN